MVCGGIRPVLVCGLVGGDSCFSFGLTGMVAFSVWDISY